MQTLEVPYRIGFAGKAIVFVRQKKYELLLLSFMLLIFGNTFSSSVRFTGMADIYQNMITGAIVFYHKKRLRISVILIMLFSILLNIFGPELHFMDVRSWQGILYLIFFSLVALEVFKVVLYSKRVSRELLSAALCGFVLLCLIGTFLFYQIDVEVPHSFANTGEPNAVLSNLNYFSFTTLLTTGYGDITPVTLLARRAVMFIGLMGHFYTVFVTSIIIGKYLSAERGNKFHASDNIN